MLLGIYLSFHCNLNDLEIIEWANLSHLLSSIVLRNLDDYWSWPLDPSNNFTVKSLMEALVGTPTPSANGHYSVIWKDIICFFASNY